MATSGTLTDTSSLLGSGLLTALSSHLLLGLLIIQQL